MAVIAGGALTVLVGGLLQSSYDRVTKAAYETLAADEIALLYHELDETVDGVTAVASFFDGSEDATRDEFQRMSWEFLREDRALHGLFWVRAVRDRDRSAVVQWGETRVAPGFDIQELHGEETVPSGSRDDYLVITYASPAALFADTLGLDIQLNPERSEALAAARDLGVVQLADAYGVVAPTDQATVLAVRPVFVGGARPSTVSERRRLLEGFVVGQFEVGELVHRAAMHEERVVAIDDVTDPSDSLALYARDTPAGPYAVRRELPLAGRTWRFTLEPSPSDLRPAWSGAALWSVPTGLLLTLLLGAALWSLNERAKRGHELAEARSRELVRQRETDATRRALDKEVQQAERLESLRVLAGGVAHDFNNLLTAILGNADLALLEGHTHPEVRARLEEIVTTAGLASDLTRQMMAYTGNAGVRFSSVVVAEVIDAALDELRHQVPEGVRVSVSVGPEGLALLGDARQVAQAIHHLVANAVEAVADTAGEVQIAVAVRVPTATEVARGHGAQLLADERYATISVTDDGPGVDPALHDRLFEPFYSTRFPGRGLGLSAAQGIARAHGGGVTVTSKPGEGTSVTLFLGLGRGQQRASKASGSASALVSAPPRPAKPVSGPRVVLVVDDEPDLRMIASMGLERGGYAVLEAADGVEAEEVFRAHHVDAVVLDVTMPRRNGMDTMVVLRELRPEVPIVLTTGLVRPELGVGAAGPDAILGKPWGIDELLGAVGGVIDA